MKENRYKTRSLNLILIGFFALQFTAFAQESDTPPIFKAIEKNNYQQVESMLKSGTDPNDADILRNTPLHMAAFYGYEKIVELLVQKGGDINAKNEAGRTPLYNAVEADHVQAVETLIQNGASLSQRYSDNRYTVLHIAALDRRYDVSEALLAGGANKKAKDALGKKPIQYAKATKDKTFVALYKDKRWR